MSEIKRLFVIYLGANDLNIKVVGEDLKKVFDEYIDECENYNCENYLELMADALHSNQYSPGEFSIGVLYYVEDHLTDPEIYKKFIISLNETFVDEEDDFVGELVKVVVGYEMIEGYEQDLSDLLDIVNDYYDENDIDDIVLVDPSKFQVAEKFKKISDESNIRLYQLEYDVIYDERRDWIEISKELDTDWEDYIYEDESDEDESDEDESDE